MHFLMVGCWLTLVFKVRLFLAIAVPDLAPLVCFPLFCILKTGFRKAEMNRLSAFSCSKSSDKNNGGRLKKKNVFED